MSATSSENSDVEYDVIVEHFINNVLAQALGGKKLANRWLEKLYLKGYVTIFDVIELTPGKLEDLGFPEGNCNLWRIFKEYVREKAEEWGKDEVLEVPDDFWVTLSAEDFKSYRILNSKVSLDTTFQ